MRHLADSPRKAARGSKTVAQILLCALFGLMLCLAMVSCGSHAKKTAKETVKQTSGVSRDADAQEGSSTAINAPAAKNPAPLVVRSPNPFNANALGSNASAPKAEPDNAAAKDTPAPAAQTQSAHGGETLPTRPVAKEHAQNDAAKAAPNTPAENNETKAQPAGQRASAEDPTPIKQPADFNECVRVALTQSPVLVNSSLEIQSKRLDVQDAWAGFIPTLTINTTYWLALPQAYTTQYQSVWSDSQHSYVSIPYQHTTATTKPYSISFSTGQWNPIVSSFDVAAKNQMVNIAILAHLKVVSTGLYRLAADFLQLEAIGEQQAIVGKKIELAKSNLEFFKTRQGLGQATQMDIRIAETKIKMAQAESDNVGAQRAQVMNDIKFMLGVPFMDKLTLDVDTAKKQILGSFSAADVTEDKIKTHSFDLRMAEYEKSLQRKNIGLAYVKLLPSFGFTFQTLDAFVATSQQHKGQFPFYPGINVSMPLDYWTKGRDVSRQYKKLDQQQASTRAKTFEVIVTVQKAMTDYQTATSDLSLASSRSELAKLQDEQTEYRYKTGQADYDKFSADRAAYFDSQQAVIMQQVRRDLALLALKDITGDLQNQYIDVTSWEK